MKLYHENLKSIFFPVEKIPAVEIMKNDLMEFNSDNSYAIVAQPADGRVKTLNFCSDIYQLIKNQDVLEPLVPVLTEKFAHLNMSVGNDKDAQFSVRISPVVPTFSPRTEVIMPLITFTNSYDGKVLAQATGGLVRHLVDAKGTVFTTFSTYLKDLSFSYKFKHNNEGIYSMIGLSEKIDKYLAEFTLVTEQVERLKAFTLKKGEKGLEKFVTEMAKGTIFPLKGIEATLERIAYENMILETESNLWNIYNAMNYITENTEQSLTKKMRMDVDAKVYANMIEFMEVELKKQNKRAIKLMVA